jgi:signal peptidase I
MKSLTTDFLTTKFLSAQLFRQILSILLKFVALVAILYLVSLAGLQIAGFDFAVVVSDSMSPTISRGDLVILHSVDKSKLENGQIIQFKRDNQLILHRISNKAEAGFRTKGDANSGFDPELVKRNQIRAEAVGLLKGFAFPIIFFKNVISFPATYSKFTSHKTKPAKTESTIWTDPAAKWKQITGGGYYAFTSPSSITSTGTGNRVVLITRNLDTDNSLYSLLRLSYKDPTNAVVYIHASVCLSGSTITCGWSIGLSDSWQSILVQTFSTTGIKQPPIYTKSISKDFGIQNQIIVYATSALLQVRINGVIEVNIANPNAFATSKGMNAPSGTYFGFSTINANQFKSTKTVTW